MQMGNIFAFNTSAGGLSQKDGFNFAGHGRVYYLTFPCLAEQSFLGSLLPERLSFSAAGRNGM